MGWETESCWSGVDEDAIVSVGSDGFPTMQTKGIKCGILTTGLITT